MAAAPITDRDTWDLVQILPNTCTQFKMLQPGQHDKQFFACYCKNIIKERVSEVLHTAQLRLFLANRENCKIIWPRSKLYCSSCFLLPHLRCRQLFVKPKEDDSKARSLTAAAAVALNPRKEGRRSRNTSNSNSLPFQLYSIYCEISCDSKRESNSVPSQLYLL